MPSSSGCTAATSRKSSSTVLREYAAYRIFNLVTPESFRARLAKVTYVDTGTKKNLGTNGGC